MHAEGRDGGAVDRADHANALPVARQPHEQRVRLGHHFLHEYLRETKFGLEIHISTYKYRVGLVVWQLGWVDLDLECSTILLGQ